MPELIRFLTLVSVISIYSLFLLLLEFYFFHFCISFYVLIVYFLFVISGFRARARRVA
ncbi:hypothetical protein BJ742DRAFT_811104 [Cladochytrium replicatum]|nr:hypothetical protein BJ742DRAFT_811104 [Cladochytrium replicatum]